MVKPHLTLAVCVYLTVSVAALAQTSYVFQLPGSTSLATQIYGAGDNDFSRFVKTTSGPTGASTIVATPTGSRFYIIAPGGVFSANSAMGALSQVNGIAGAASLTPDKFQITPDGKYLLVITDKFYIVDTSNNNVVGQNAGVAPTPVSVAVSHDAKTAWVLSNTPSGSAITAVNLTTLTVAGSMSLLSSTTSIVLSSRNLLYVASTGAAIFEIDPISLSVTISGQMDVPNGSAGPIQFTPDGNTAYFLNRTSCDNCPPIFKLSAPAHSISGWLPANGVPPTLNQVLVAGNNRVFALSSASHKLWDVNPTPLSLTQSVIGSLPTGDVVAAAVSNERSSARFLYLLITDQNFYRVNLATNAIDTGGGAAVSGLDPVNGTILSFVPIPAQTGPTSLFQINPVQSVAPGGAAVLVGQVLDSVGRPVFGVPVSFSTNACVGLTIATPSQVTTSEGWAQTAVTAPAAAGSCTVTLTSGSLSAEFQLAVGGGTTGGSSVMSIYSGDGQLLRHNGDSTFSTLQPLTVKITDAAGNPMSNIAVAFARTEGGGSVTPAESVTDANGLASTNFTTGLLLFGTHFELSKITATSVFGSLEFYETTHDRTATQLFQPNTSIVTPADQHITIPQGGFQAAGITARTISGTAAAPIPNVGLRLADPNNVSAPSPVISCQGLSRGDNNGISRCDLKAACQSNVALPHVFTAYVYVGEFNTHSVQVTVTNATPSLLVPVFPAAGNNQAGNPGDVFTLKAQVTDGCSQPASNFSGMNWTIQGSGALSLVQTTTDGAGNVTARVTLGQTAGAVQVQLVGPGLTPIVFNLTTQVLATTISLVSGSGQSTGVGQPFPNPVVFVVRNANNSPVANVPVTFSASQGAFINPSTASTNEQGQVQTIVTAGGFSGTIVVTATAGALSATANLTATLLGPQVTVSSFKNAAYEAHSQVLGMTPCGLVTVRGTGLAPNIQGVVSGVAFFGPLPLTLAGASITVQQGANTYSAPIQAVANQGGVQQINFQAPCELIAGTANVTITVGGGFTTVAGVQVLAAQPGIFTFAGANNKLYGAVIRAADGSYVTPSNLARRGDRLYMLVTGLGLVSPSAVTNGSGTGSQNVVLQTVVGVSDKGVPVLSARYLAGAIGAYLVEFQLPADAPLGPDQSLAVAAIIDGNFVFGNPVLLPGVIAAPAP